MSYFGPKAWDSNFFGRSIYSGELSVKLEQRALEVEVNELDVLGVTLIEARIKSSHIENISILEDLGFRLVDSRLEFRTLSKRNDFEAQLDVGSLRWFENRDWNALADLTLKQFPNNDNFRSRYNNRRYFSLEESRNYYLEWHRWALESPTPLLCVWEVKNRLVGFYSVIRRAQGDAIPEYKVGLAAVHPDFRSYQMQNQMQFWIFQNAPDPEWYTINSPALSNISGLKNNIRAGKNLSYVEFYLFRESI
jgi:hypothetical protein